MKRAVVVAHSFPTISETFIVDHVEGLRRAGWDVLVATGQVNTQRLRALVAEGRVRVPVEQVRVPPRSIRLAADAAVSCARALAYSPRAAVTEQGLLVRAFALEQLFRRLRPGLVHAHFADNGIWAALASRGRIPVLVDFHGHDFTVLPARIGWRTLRHALRDCSLVAHSEFAVDRIRSGLGRAPAVVQLGVDLGLFHAAPRRDEWPDPIRWLVVGRLEQKKGQEVAIRALAIARADPRHRSPVLTIAGDGSRRPALEALARDLGVAPYVRFTGPLSHPDVAEAMAAADLLLVPSVPAPDGWVEAFGRVAIEGLASGIPVIVSDLGGLPEAIGDAGWTVRAGDSQALATGVARVIAGGTPAAHRVRSLARARSLSNERMWAEYAEASRAASGRRFRA